ncbi:MAG: hypothetical protein LBB84_02890 [Tannerellaceae bacterium]|jgi:pyruvate-formate lyase-activating enzyme|nr:hypothetical protein [Tannerellaceae bacterium]
MIMSDYIPRKDTELLLWGENFCTRVADNATDWGIPTAEVTALQAAQTAFAEILPAASGPLADSVTIERKNEARHALVEKIRGMAAFRLQNPILTNADRLLLGLHVHDTKPTTIPVPTTRPNFELKVTDVRRIAVHFHDQDSAGRARPYGVNGAVVYYDVLDAPPPHPDALSRSLLATHTPYTLEFVEEERGKAVYVALRWQNEKGQKGPWSEIESTVVP